MTDRLREAEQPGERRFRDLLARERQDMAWLVHVVAVMYDEISGGRISQPMTYPEEVLRAFEERVDDAVAVALEEHAEPAPAQPDDLRARLAVFARLLEAEWYNGNMGEDAYERLNADLSGLVAAYIPQPAPALDVEARRYTAYVDGRACHNCGQEPYRHLCPAEEVTRGQAR